MSFWQNDGDDDDDDDELITRHISIPTIHVTRTVLPTHLCGSLWLHPCQLMIVFHRDVSRCEAKCIGCSHSAHTSSLTFPCGSFCMSIVTGKHPLIFRPHSPHGMSHPFHTHCGLLGFFCRPQRRVSLDLALCFTISRNHHLFGSLMSLFGILPSKRTTIDPQHLEADSHASLT
jgi:hypothetical protein